MFFMCFEGNVHNRYCPIKNTIIGVGTSLVTPFDNILQTYTCNDTMRQQSEAAK